MKMKVDRQFNCKKCSSSDICIRFRRVGDRLDFTIGAPRTARREEATIDCLYCVCRTCGHWWIESPSDNQKQLLLESDDTEDDTAFNDGNGFDRQPPNRPNRLWETTKTYSDAMPHCPVCDAVPVYDMFNKTDRCMSCGWSEKRKDCK